MKEARATTIKDLLLVIDSLNKKDVKYVLIGGYALFMHGIFRTTTDIDILIPQNEDNGKNVINALLVLPDKSANEIDLDWFKDGETIRLADEVVVDIMFNASGESYETLEKYVQLIEYEGVKIRTLNLEGLLKTKNTLRDKDNIDKLLIMGAIGN